MTAPIVLGPQPVEFRLNLPAGADFVAEIVIPDDESALDPAGSVELRFTDLTPVVVWAATIDPAGRLVRWNVDEIDVDAVLAAGPRKVRLHYELAESDLLWARGRTGGV